MHTRARAYLGRPSVRGGLWCDGKELEQCGVMSEETHHRRDDRDHGIALGHAQDSVVRAEEEEEVT